MANSCLTVTEEDSNQSRNV